jgi:hypothetical protein
MNDITVVNNSSTSLADGKPMGEPKTHVIVTFTKTHYFITQKQYDAINQLSVDGHTDSVEIDGSRIFFKNIADIPTLDKYRESFPDKVSDTHQPYSEPPKETGKLFEGDALAKLIEVLEKDYDKHKTEGRRRQLVSLKELKRRRDTEGKQFEKPSN